MTTERHNPEGSNPHLYRSELVKLLKKSAA
jgi:hypothetical protein